MQQKKSNKYISVAEDNERTLNQYPNIREITIPREVLDMYDLTPYDKLLYGLIYSGRGHKRRIANHNICGLLCINDHAVWKGMKRLEAKGLMEKAPPRFVSPTKSAPNLYKAKVPPRRFIGKTQPHYIKSNIDNLEEDINDYFDEITI